jgi:Universal stress protein family
LQRYNKTLNLGSHELLSSLTQLLKGLSAVTLFILIPNLSWAAEDGATIYKTKCAVCHGADATGKVNCLDWSNAFAQMAPASSGPLEFRRILFATDFGAAAATAFPYALSLAEDYQAKLVLLHMVPPMPVADLGSAAYGPSCYAAEEYTNWQRATRNEGMRKLRKLLPPTAELAAEPEYVAGMDFLP